MVDEEATRLETKFNVTFNKKALIGPYSIDLQKYLDYDKYEEHKQIWGVCGTTAKDKLQKLQNRAARIVTNSLCSSNYKGTRLADSE